MPAHQDRYEINLELVTIAGTVYAMQADLSHYEDVAELEDDILCFLPTVSDLDVFGCELELLNLHTQQPLPEAFRTVLLQRPQLQIVVRPCMVDGHSIWQFQDDGKESYPKAVRVPANPRGEIADRAFYAAPSLRRVEVATGIQHVLGRPTLATLESTAFLALGFGAVNGQDFRTRRDPLGRFTLFLISQLVSGSRVSLTRGLAGPAGVETAGREHGSCNHAVGE